MDIGVIDSYYGGSNIHYKEDTNFYKLYKNNFVVKDAIDYVARKFSNTKFEDMESEDSKLLQKLTIPNSFQSRNEFLKDLAINILCSGYSMVWKKYSSFGVFDTLELIVLSTDADITQVGKNSVTTAICGKIETISVEDIIFFYDSQRQTNSLKGVSRLLPLKSQIENITDAQRAKSIQIRNSGITIVSPKSSGQSNSIDEGLDKPIITMQPQILPNGQRAPKMKTQKEEMEDSLNSRGMENRIIVSSKGVDAKNLSAELNSVDFSKKIESDILSIYTAFGVPEELTPYGKNATYDNKNEAENALIESEIQPLNDSFTESVNEEFRGFGSVVGNYNHLSSVSKTKNEIHKTNKDIAETYRLLFEKEVITQDEAREMLLKNGIL